MRFHELRLTEPIVRAVATEGYTTPTPIQTKAIPPILKGHDVLGCAQTGTGKTAAFALPILHRLAATTKRAGPRDGKSARNSTRHSTPPAGRRPRALVLSPTRELASQIHESFGAYGRHLPLRHAVIFGGVSQVHQVRRLRDGVDVLVATPGRLLDLMGQKLVDLSEIETFVLDEADRMLDMGFIRDIRRIIECLPRERQNLLFSATMPPEIRRLANDILRDPVSVQAGPTSTTVEAIAQSVYMVTKKNKPALLERILRQDTVHRTLVFTRTKHGSNKLVRGLHRAGIKSEAIHGNKSQAARTRALNGFKSGTTKVLVATDLASRGIDVDEISHVINYDVPNVPETYVHRIGRTARAGASGHAFSFCDHEEINDLRAIERLIDMKIDVARNAPDLVFQAPAAGPAPRGSSPSRRPAGNTNRRRQRRSQSRRSPRSAA